MPQILKKKKFKKVKSHLTFALDEASKMLSEIMLVCGFLKGTGKGVEE